MVLNGLDILAKSKEAQDKVIGNIGYLCHSASVDIKLTHGVLVIQEIFKERLIKIFGPQHGFVTDVQDNMVESEDYIHPFFNIPVHSLYSETRIPTDKMLEGLDTILVDLQDVGTRVYTYISTLGLLMKKCEDKNIKVIVLDRPNPVGGEIIEGTIVEDGFHSFVGHHKIPQRHALTMAEVGLFTQKYLTPNCNYDYIKMNGWSREMFFEDTKQTWINPSPNLSTPNSALTFVGTVLFEGTNLSEGRGTTRALEVVGHPLIEPFEFTKELNEALKETDLTGFILRPIAFMPTFQKFKDECCGGVHIHVTEPKKFKSWKLGQFLCRKFAEKLDEHFEFHTNKYEYEKDRMAIDLINGTDKVTNWIYTSGDLKELESLEQEHMTEYNQKRAEILLY